MRLTGFDWCEGSRITSHGGISLWFSGHDLCTHWYFAKEWSRSLMNIGDRMEFAVCKRESAVHCMSITSTMQQWFLTISVKNYERKIMIFDPAPALCMFDIHVKSRPAVRSFRTTCPDWVSQTNEDMRCHALYLIWMPLSAVRLHGPQKSNTFCDLAAGLKVDLPNSV